MKILVTGATGFVGKSVCTTLIGNGYQVVGAVRRVPADKIAGVEYVTVGEINRETDWAQALEGVQAIIHLAARVHVMNETALDPLREFRAVNVEGTERLARMAAAQGVARFVYVSSIKVNGDETTPGNPFSERDRCSPEDPYGMSKWEAEQALTRISGETGLEVVIVRPPLVYGPGVGGNFLEMFKFVSRGLPLPLAGVRNLRSLIYVGNLADALMACATNPKASGQLYLVSDGEDVSTPELLRLVASNSGMPARLFFLPVWLMLYGAKMLGKSAQAGRLLGSLQVNSDKIRRELNWKPPFTLAQGFETTAAWYRNINK